MENSQSTPPFSLSLTLFPALSSSLLSSLSVSVFLPPSFSPAKISQAFSRLCFAVAVVDQYNGKARERRREKDRGMEEERMRGEM